jgi:hypothetical protein
MTFQTGGWTMTSCVGGALGPAAFLLFLTEHSPERAKMIGFGGSVTPSAPAGPEGRGGRAGHGPPLNSSSAAFQEGDCLRLRDDLGHFRCHIEQVLLVRPRVAIAAGVADHERRKAVAERVERGRADAAQGREAGDPQRVHARSVQGGGERRAEKADGYCFDSTSSPATGISVDGNAETRKHGNTAIGDPRADTRAARRRRPDRADRRQLPARGQAAEERYAQNLPRLQPRHAP